MLAGARNIVQGSNRSVDVRLLPAMRMPSTLVTITLVTAAALGTRANAQCGETKLLASDAHCGAVFGAQVAMDGDVLAVGAPEDSSVLKQPGPGAAYVFRRLGTQWVQEQELVASDPGEGARFGSGVAVSGDRVIVGAPDHSHDVAGFDGSAYVFRWDGAQWVHEQELLPSDPQPLGHFGGAVAMSGNVAAISGNHEVFGGGTQAGSVYIFRWNGTTWFQEQKLTASDAANFDGLGASVSLANNVVAAGAPLKAGGGAVYIFRRSGSAWTQEQKLFVEGATDLHRFGSSVSVNGDTIAIGADDNGSSSAGPGAVYVYRWTGPEWTQQQKLVPSDAEPGLGFGKSLSASLKHLLIGAGAGNARPGSGVAYFFTLIGGRWVQTLTLTASDTEPNDGFASSVALAECFAVVGALGNNDACPEDPFGFSGAAYVYDARGCLRCIPTLSGWGFLVMTVVVLGTGIVVIKRGSRKEEVQ